MGQFIYIYIYMCVCVYLSYVEINSDMWQIRRDWPSQNENKMIFLI